MSADAPHDPDRDDHRPRNDAGGDLPPVSPPSAGFLMQLFVIPLVIVTIIATIILMLNWLLSLGTKPEDLVNDLNRLNAGSWQKALTIANLLCDPQQDELRKNSEVAGRLAEILNDQIDDGGTDPEEIKLRVYLCTALGVFEIDDGLPSLLRAATTQNSLKEVEVRLAALEAIARQADSVPNGREMMRGNSELMRVLFDASQQTGGSTEEKELDRQLRSRAAYALGVIGGDEALNRLALMLSDPDPAVRFNAATGLARNGDARATLRLCEMLDPTQVSAPDGEPIDKATQIRIMSNALRASAQLATANPAADLSDLRQAVQELLERKPGGALTLEAELVLKSLQTPP